MPCYMHCHVHWLGALRVMCFGVYPVGDADAQAMDILSNMLRGMEVDAEQIKRLCDFLLVVYKML